MLSYSEFIHCNLVELNFVLEAYNVKLKNDVMLKAHQDYNLAVQIATFVGCALSGKDIPSFDELNPTPESQARAAFVKFKELADAVNLKQQKRSLNSEFRDTNSQTND